MAYSIENGIWGSVFAVPSDIVDKHLKLCGEFPLKVLLILLRHGRMMDCRELAAILGRSEADIQDAIEYWVLMGVLHGDNTPLQTVRQEIAPPQEPVPARAEEQAPPVLAYIEIPDEKSAGQRVTKLTNSRQRLTTADINEMAKTDDNIACLLQEVQGVLGKELTPVATDTIAALYSYYGMQPDLILMLVHYCVSIGKGSMRYIEKVAATWLEKGIDTHELAEAEIQRITQKNLMENKVKAAFGIHDRSLVTSEKNFIRTWVEEYKLDIQLITLAYERTVEQKGKLSFAYTNAILQSWHAKGIATPVQAMQEMRADKPAKPEGRKEDASSYDMGELENMITYGAIL